MQMITMQMVPAKRDYSDTTWTNKETCTLAALVDYVPGHNSVHLSQYGGWMERKTNATGYFYAKKIDNRWWLVDPDGCYYLNAGIASVNTGSSETCKKNLATRFGSKAAWADYTINMLHKHGFNGTGAWSDIQTLRQSENKIPYTIMCNFLTDFARSKKLARPGVGHSEFVGDCIPIFHPDFPEFADEYAKKHLEITRDDPYVVGIFSDNELMRPLLKKYLSLDPKNPNFLPGYNAAHDWIVKKKGRQDVKLEDITEEESNEFMGFAFEHYYKIISEAIRKHDSNHLYLGSRIHWVEKYNPYFWKAAGKYVDVISVNYYRVWGPEIEKVKQWEEWSNKPMMVTEWYAKGDDVGFTNRSGIGWIVKTQKDRGHFYQHYVLGLLECKSCVGWHWFKYMDNDPNDKNAEGSNQDSNKGIVRTDYTEYEELLNAMSEINTEIYPLTSYFDSK